MYKLHVFKMIMFFFPSPFLAFQRLCIQAFTCGMSHSSVVSGHHYVICLCTAVNECQLFYCLFWWTTWSYLQCLTCVCSISVTSLYIITWQLLYHTCHLVHPDNWSWLLVLHIHYYLHMFCKLLDIIWPVHFSRWQIVWLWSEIRPGQGQSAKHDVAKWSFFRE